MSNVVRAWSLLAILALAPASATSQQVTQQGAAPTAASNAELAARASLEGKLAATNAGGWFGRGVAIGVFTGLIGTVVTYAIAGSSGVELPPEQQLQIAAEPAAYQLMFTKGYADQVRSKRKSTSLAGGVIGTAALVALVLSAGSSGQ
jgi:hypothetical protein